MKWSFAVLAVVVGLGVVACTENQPGSAGSRHSSVNDLAKNTAQQPAARLPERAPVPEGAEWTIFCDKMTGSGHVERAQEFKNELIRTTGRSEFYIVHHDDESVLYFGFYGEIADTRKPQEMQRAKADLRQVASLNDKFGNPLFRTPSMMRLESPDPDAPPEWNLANAPSGAFWSLQIGAYKDSIDRKKFAVEAVREARKQGLEYYYYHGETISSVCYGTWPKEAVKLQPGARTDDPEQPMLVLGGSRAPDNISSDLRDANGRRMKLIAPKLEFADPSLDAAIKEFKYHAVNGDVHGKRVGDQIIYDPSFLVQIPRPKEGRSLLSDKSQSPGPQRSQELPPTLQGYQDPDPTLGALRSLGGK